MKHKLLIALLVLLVTFCLAFSISACNQLETDLSDGYNNGYTDKAEDSSKNNENTKTYEDKVIIQGIEYKLSDDKTYYIVNDFDSSATLNEVVIQSEYGGLPVKEIGSSSFKYCYSLTSIIIPNSVTSIGYDAFYDCYDLTSITIPNSVKNIGSCAFKYCFRLVEVYNFSMLEITKGSEENGYIGYYARDVYISKDSASKLHTEDNYIFYEDGEIVYLIGCIGNLTTLTLPDKYNNKNYSIYKYAFYDCNNLAEVTIPYGVTSVGYAAFSGCSNLQYNEYNNAYYLGNTKNPYYALIKVKSEVSSCEINENTKIIASGAFERLYFLKRITIPDSVTTIGNSAFYSCWNLTCVTIENGVKSIGDYAFGRCSELTSITIPNSVTSIGYGAFYCCSNLTSVTFENTSGWRYSYDSNVTSGGSILNENLANSSTAATYLKSTYCDCFWENTVE